MIEVRFFLELQSETTHSISGQGPLPPSAMKRSIRSVTTGSAAIRCMKMRTKNGQNRLQTVTLITCTFGCDSACGRFLNDVYNCICCPDPCYEPHWTALADSAFFVDAALGTCGLLICLLFVGGEINIALLRGLRHHHRAHAP